MSGAGNEGWEKQPWKREHVQRPWERNCLPYLRNHIGLERSLRAGLCLYDYLFLFSFGEDQGQQSQSPGEEGPLEGESMSQSVNPDPDPDPWIKPG